jgi:integrase
MAIYKRTKKNGKTVYDLVYYDDQGKQKWKTFSTKKAADDYEAKVRVAKRENNYQEVFAVKPEYTTTFNELAGKYIELHQGLRSWGNSRAYTVKALQEEFGDRKLAQITRLELEQWRKKRLSKADGSPRKPASVDQDLAIFHHMLAKAKEWGLLQNSPFDTGSSLFFRPDNARKRYATLEELEALLQACPPDLALIVEVAVITGLRKGNVLGLTWEMVNLKNRFIDIPASEMKAKKAFKFPINDRLAEILGELRRKNQLRSPYVFCDERGRQIKDIWRAFKKALKQAGLEDFTFHDLRHTFASHLIMNGADLVTLGSLLAHADIKTTMRYSHLSQEHRAAAANLAPNLRKILDSARAK